MSSIYDKDNVFEAMRLIIAEKFKIDYSREIKPRDMKVLFYPTGKIDADGFPDIEYILDVGYTVEYPNLGISNCDHFDKETPLLSLAKNLEMMGGPG